jgi:hypothetical protein
MWYVDEYAASSGIQPGGGNYAVQSTVSTLLAIILPSLLAVVLSSGTALL